MFPNFVKKSAFAKFKLGKLDSLLKASPLNTVTKKNFLKYFY